MPLHLTMVWLINGNTGGLQLTNHLFSNCLKLPWWWKKVTDDWSSHLWPLQCPPTDQNLGAWQLPHIYKGCSIPGSLGTFTVDKLSMSKSGSLKDPEIHLATAQNVIVEFDVTHLTTASSSNGSSSSTCSHMLRTICTEFLTMDNYY